MNRDGLDTFCLAGPKGDAARAMLEQPAELVWTVEASSHFEAMTLYYKFRGRGKYTTDQEWDYASYRDHGWE